MRFTFYLFNAYNECCCSIGLSQRHKWFRSRGKKINALFPWLTKLTSAGQQTPPNSSKHTNTYTTQAHRIHLYRATESQSNTTSENYRQHSEQIFFFRKLLCVLHGNVNERKRKEAREKKSKKKTHTHTK